MIKRISIIVAAAAAAMAAAGPAQATDGPAYSITFYSDATLTTPVGFARAVCLESGPSAQLWWGTSSPYQEVHDAGVCIDGVLWPS
jgi:predicted secreted protein